MDETFAADPDTLVVLFPCPWELFAGEDLAEIHAEHWQERATFSITRREDMIDEGILATGEVHFEGEEHVHAELIVEAPLEGIEQLASTSAEPLTPTEQVMLAQHQSIWRVHIQAGSRLGRRAAKRMSQLMATFIEAGACSAVLPGLMRLHSGRFIRKQTMDLFSPQGVANLFVGAWHEEGWMRTRGLTAFGLPEIETRADGGLNGAYFLLMDVAANMLMQMARYPGGAHLQIGPREYRLIEGPNAPFEQDEDVPHSGHFGVQTVTPI